MSPQTEFGLGAFMSSAAICFPSHRSLITVGYFIALFEYQVAFLVKTRSSKTSGSECFAFLGHGIVLIFRQTL